MQLHLDRLDPAQGAGARRHRQGVEPCVHDVADQPAAAADEVVVPGDVGVIAGGAGRRDNPLDEAEFSEAGQGAVHRVERDGRHLPAHGAEDALDVGVLIAGGDLAHDLEPLVSEAQAGGAQGSGQRSDASLTFLG